ncbi:MFS transporter [Actinoplanes palleronii]|uniref:MFS transporter n=1 Tax=Actinoplanes palleronii TaxID=113570 RepID=A0ABQ4B5X7_9ACTN|nr:MFS transporter [Actinoplanes palleronii]GIE65982.1 MFS transporter [Actinoplanes palleronii]
MAEDRTVRLLLAAELTTALGIGLTEPYVIVLLHDVRGLSLTAATGVLALAAVAGLLGSPFAGALIDRYGGRPMMAAGLALAVAGLPVVAAATGVVPVAAGIAVTALGFAVSIPALVTLLATLTPAHDHRRIYTLQYTVYNIGMATGAALGGLALAHRPLIPLLWAAAALTCLAALGMTVSGGPRATPRPAPAPPGGYRHALADRRLVRLLGAAALLSTVGFGIFSAAPPVLAIAAHDPAALSWVSVANCVAVVAGAPLATRCAGRFSARAALLSTATLWALAWAVCIPTVLGAGLSTRAALTCAAILTGAGELLIAGALPALVDTIAPAPLRGRCHALSSLAQTAGMAAGPLLVTATTATGRPLLLLSAAIALSAAATGLLLEYGGPRRDRTARRRGLTRVRPRAR